MISCQLAEPGAFYFFIGDFLAFLAGEEDLFEYNKSEACDGRENATLQKRRNEKGLRQLWRQ